MRMALLVFHRWLALVTGVLILVVAATGSALVFEGAIDRALNPSLWRVTPTGVPLSLDTVAARARAAQPGPPITGLVLSRAPGRAYVAQSGPIEIFVDPFTGRVN